MIIRTRRRRIAALLVFHSLAWSATGYFVMAAQTGERGLAAKREAKAKTDEALARIGEARAERLVWERKVSQLAGPEIDRDLLDERLRAVLNLSHRNELVILVGDPEVP